MTMLQKVLVVDASKLVRASLAKYLRGCFEIVEDVDGESAWQTLVLDSSIVAVIAGAKLAVLDSLGLVERMRENRLGRLNRMPFFMLVSDSFSAAERQAGRLCGVSDFIAKGMAGPEVKALLLHFVEQVPLVDNRRPVAAPVAPPAPEYTGEASLIVANEVMGQVARLSTSSEATIEETVLPVAARSFLDHNGIVAHLKEVLPTEASLGVLVFGLDGYNILSRCFGEAPAQRVTQKISKMLADKIRTDDRIALLPHGHIVIMAPQTDLALCSGFADRVCKALAAAQISLRGQRLGMSISVGVAAMPDDGESISAQELLALATSRLETAMREGGNRVRVNDCSLLTSHTAQDFLRHLKEVLTGVRPEILSASLGSAGLQLLPLLARIEQKLQLGLPLDDLARHLETLAKSEQASS